MVKYVKQNTGLIVVLNTAALRLLGNVRNYTLCRILGQSVINDGGQGFFYWDPLSVLADDGFDILQATGVTVGRWIRTRSTPVASNAETAEGVIDYKGVSPAGLASLNLETPPTFYVWQKQESPVSVASIIGWNERELNTLDVNDIGITMPDNYTLRTPSGSYVAEVFGIASKVNLHMVKLFNDDDGIDLCFGSVEFSDSTAAKSPKTSVIVGGYFSITGEKDIKLLHYTQNVGTLGLDPSPIPVPYNSASVRLTKVG